MCSDLFRDENAVLHAASGRLTQATTPADQLEAVSAYARSQGAACGILFHLDDQELQQEVVARWATGSVLTPEIGQRFDTPDFAHMVSPMQPALFEDAQAEPLMSAQSRAFSAQYRMRGLAVLPLYNKGRWIGVVLFAWEMPRHFDERDRQLYAALQGQAAPVIDALRLYEQAQRRATELEKAKNEMDILYAISNRMARASTPYELLDVAGSYARDHGAKSCMLLYVRDEPDIYMEVVEALGGEQAAMGIGACFDAGYDILRHLQNSRDLPILVENIQTDPRLDATTRRAYLACGRGASALLPLNNRGRWIGALMFNWDTPHPFDDRDRRVYTALIQQASPIVDSIRLFEQNRERAARAERLLKINTGLSQAADETQIVAAMLPYARLQGADAINLDLLDFDTDGRCINERTVATWTDGELSRYDPERHRLFHYSDFGLYLDLWSSEPYKPLLIEDIATDPRIPEDARRQMLQTLKSRAVATLPLHSGGRCHGSLYITWFSPHTFTEEEIDVYTTLMQTLGAAVATRREYLAKEEARQEAEYLYRASRAVNAALSYEELVEAVTLLNLNSLVVTLAVWENFDFDTATYAEIVAASFENPWAVGTRIPLADIPPTLTMSRDKLLVIEDTRIREQIDERTAATLEANGYRSFMTVPLCLGARFLGVLTFQSGQPRTYTEGEKRLMTGIGDLMLAALERIRLQAETETARQQAELVAQINGALLQATDEQAILSSVALLARRYGTSLSLLAYTDHARRLDIVALDSDGRSPLPAGILPITTFSPEDYPLLNMAYAYPDEVLFIENSATDPRTAEPRAQAFAQAVNWAASILIPLKSAEQWQGILAFAWETPRLFDAETRRLFNAIRPTASSVVTGRRAYLAEEAARRETEQRARALAALEERTRLARELHDSVSQALYGIGLGARTARTLMSRDPARLAEPLDYILSLVEAGLTEMRALIFELRPESLEQEGLVSVLTKQAASLQTRHGIAVRTSFDDEPPLRLEVKESLYRIAREALHNTIKHARATQVELSLTHESDGYQLEIADDGLGFDPSGDFPGHLGLKSMRERTASLNGSFYMYSAPGKGTRIRVRIPNGTGLEAKTDESGAD